MIGGLLDGEESLRGVVFRVVAHPVSVPFPNLAQLSPEVSRVKVRHVYDGTEPSSVTFTPRELRPFELRYRFWRMVDEDLDDGDPRKRVWWLAGAPDTIEPDTPEPSEWTPRHARALADNAYAYRRYAESALDMRVSELVEAREEMLILSEDDYKWIRPEDLPNLFLLALEHEVQARLDEGYTLDEIAVRRLNISVGTLHRRRREAKRRGLRQ